MIRLDDRTVQFDRNGEVEAHDRFNELLDDGHGIPMAAAMALNEMAKTHSPPTEEFIEYLSEGTCQVYFDTVGIKPEWRT